MSDYSPKNLPPKRNPMYQFDFPFRPEGTENAWQCFIRFPGNMKMADLPRFIEFVRGIVIETIEPEEPKA
jgi:hypothetical protein